jgi:hypothetical protein
MSINSLDIDLESPFLAGIRSRGELDDGVERDLEIRKALEGVIHKVGVQAPEDGLVSNDQDVLLSFQIHEHGFQALNYIPVRLAILVPVVVLIVIALGKIFRELFLDLFVCQRICLAGFEFVQCLPSEFFVGEVFSGGDGTFLG